MNSSTLYLFGFIIILFVILGVVLLFITFNNRKNQLLKENLEQQLTAQKRQYESDLNALRSQLNPHFVHNSLNAIQYYIQRNEVEISESYLSKFSKLMRLFFDYSRKKEITLSEEVAFIKNYLTIEKLRFEDKLNFDITVDSQIDTEEFIIPTMLLQPMVENAVNHGIFHKSSTGHIHVEFKRNKTDNAYTVSIIDDGIGIHESKKINKKRAGKGKAKSHSSSVIEERIALLNDSKEWEIQYSIEDQSDISDTTGTIVLLHITKIYES